LVLLSYDWLYCASPVFEVNLDPFVVLPFFVLSVVACMAFYSSNGTF
jgi:hypothetical protein